MAKSQSESSKSAQASKFKLSLIGALGAIAPDILILYSKRWTMPEVSFDIGMYLFATLFYVLLASFVSAIFPYKSLKKIDASLSWKAFCVGVALPVIISGITSYIRSPLITSRGSPIDVEGTFLDIISLF